MVTHGADTDHLRQLAEDYRSCARRMLETSGVLSAAITSVTWEGPDADGFRQQWSGVQAQIGDVGELVWEERAHPGEGGGDGWAAARGGTGRETTYMVDVGSDNGTLQETYPEAFDPMNELDGQGQQPRQIAYTEEEVRHMMDHNGDSSGDPMDYLTDRAREGTGGAERMYYDYKHVDTPEQDQRIESGGADEPPGYRPEDPGTVLEPGQNSDAVRGQGGAHIETHGGGGATGQTATTG